MLGNYLVASRVVFSSIELVSGRIFNFQKYSLHDSTSNPHHNSNNSRLQFKNYGPRGKKTFVAKGIRGGSYVCGRHYV
jgi:hypothetical protein